MPNDSAHRKLSGQPGLTDASYIDLGPPQNNRVNIIAQRQRPPENKGGIFKTYTLGTNVPYIRARLAVKSRSSMKLFVCTFCSRTEDCWITSLGFGGWYVLDCMLMEPLEGCLLTNTGVKLGVDCLLHENVSLRRSSSLELSCSRETFHSMAAFFQSLRCAPMAPREPQLFSYIPTRD